MSADSQWQDGLCTYTVQLACKIVKVEKLYTIIQPFPNCQQIVLTTQFRFHLMTHCF